MIVEIQTDQLRDESLVILWRFIDFCYDNCPGDPDEKGGLLRSHGQIAEALEDRFGPDVFGSKFINDVSTCPLRKIEFGNEKVMKILQSMNELYESEMYAGVTEAISSQGQTKQ